jgi:hypothetical protein
VRVLFSTTSGRLLDEPIFAEGAQLLAAEIAALPHVAECLTVPGRVGSHARAK